MLKPKKKITRKEIRKDPLLESLANVQTHLEEKRSLYIRVGIGILAIVAVVLFMTNRRLTADKNAETALSRALVSWEINDLENAEFQFDLLATDFGHTVSGNLGNYYLGLLKMRQDNFSSAKSAFEAFLAGKTSEMLVSNAHTELAYLYLDEGDSTQAASHFQKAISTAKTLHHELSAELDWAEYNIGTGARDKARTIIQKVLAREEIAESIKSRAQELSGKIFG